MPSFEFPWPPRALSPNQRPYWREKYEATRDYRHIVGWILRGAVWVGEGLLTMDRPLVRPPLRLETLTPPVKAHVTFVNDRRRRDDDNARASLKALWDAMVEVGLIEDDSHDKLTVTTQWEVKEKGTEPVVRVSLEEAAK